MELNNLSVGPQKQAELISGLSGLKDAIHEDLKKKAEASLQLLKEPLFNGVVTFGAGDFEKGRLMIAARDRLAKLGDGYFEAQKGKLEGGLGMSFSPEGWEDTKSFFTNTVLNVLEGKLGKAIADKKFESFEVTAKSLMDFDIKVKEVSSDKVGAEALKVEEAPKDLEAPIQLANALPSEEEQKAIKAALSGAGVLGWFASMFIFKKGKNGEESFIGKAYQDPNGFAAAFLGFIGVKGPGGEFEKAAAVAVKDLPPQAGGILASLNKMAEPCRKKLQEALGNVGEAVAAGLGVDKFMERLKGDDKEFKDGLTNELVVGGLWKVDGQARIILPDNVALKIPAGGEYGVTVDGEWKSNIPSAVYDLKGGSDKSLVVTQLPEGTIIPVGSKIISLMKEEPAVA